MNVYDHIEKTDEELIKLTTRHLDAIHKAAYTRHTCSCGPAYHCGDDVLTQEQRDANQRMRYFQKRVKAILDTRPPLPRSSKALRREAAKRGR
jgi:hypothetical protein